MSGQNNSNKSKTKKEALITEVNDNLDGTGSSIQEICHHQLGEEMKRKKPDDFKNECEEMKRKKHGDFKNECDSKK